MDYELHKRTGTFHTRLFYSAITALIGIITYYCYNVKSITIVLSIPHLNEALTWGISALFGKHLARTAHIVHNACLLFTLTILTHQIIKVKCLFIFQHIKIVAPLKGLEPLNRLINSEMLCQLSYRGLKNFRSYEIYCTTLCTQCQLCVHNVRKDFAQVKRFELLSSDFGGQSFPN